MATARAPLSRTIPTALSPVAVASATIVSAAGGSATNGVLRLAARAGRALLAVLARAARAIHQPLLSDLQHVRHGPVQREPGGDGVHEEHQCEHDGHEEHHA